MSLISPTLTSKTFDPIQVVCHVIISVIVSISHIVLISVPISYIPSGQGLLGAVCCDL